MDASAFGRGWGEGLKVLLIMALFGVWAGASIGGALLGALVTSPFALWQHNGELLVTGAAWGGGIVSVVSAVVLILFGRQLRD